METQVKTTCIRVFALIVGALLASAIAAVPATSAFADDLAAGSIDDQALTAQADSSQAVAWSRIYGETALDTMAGIVQAGWKQSEVVVISTIDGYWDALSASSLAGANSAPVLFTDKYLLSIQTRNEITRLGASKAYIVGGLAAVSDNVESQVKAMGLQVERLAGENAAGTAVAIANAVGTARADTCVIATSAGYWDALTASPYAYYKKAPIYLTNDGGTLDGTVVDAIRAAGYKSAVIAGGSAAVKDSVEGQLKSCGISNVTRCWGQTAYDTAAELSKWGVGQGLSWSGLGVATGNGYWDALAGAALCGRNGGVLLLADDSNYVAATAVLSEEKSTIGTAVVFGGPAAVSDNAYKKLQRSTADSQNAREEQVIESLNGWWQRGARQWLNDGYVYFRDGERYLFTADGTYSNQLSTITPDMVHRHDNGLQGGKGTAFRDTPGYFIDVNNGGLGFYLADNAPDSLSWLYENGKGYSGGETIGRVAAPSWAGSALASIGV